MVHTSNIPHTFVYKRIWKTKFFKTYQDKNYVDEFSIMIIVQFT